MSSDATKRSGLLGGHGRILDAPCTPRAGNPLESLDLESVQDGTLDAKGRLSDSVLLHRGRRREKLLEALAAFGASEVIVRLMALAVSATLARVLGLVALGELTVAQNLVQYALVGGDGGLTADATRRISVGEDARVVVPRTTVTQLFLTLGFLIIVISASPLVTGTGTGYLVVVATSPIAILYALNIAYVLQVQRRLWVFAAARVLGQGAATALCVFLLVGVHSSVVGVAAALTIGPLVTYGMVAARVWEDIKGALGGRIWRVVWATLIRSKGYFGSTLLVHYYSSTSLLAVAIIASAHEVGRYAVASRLLFLALAGAQIVSSALFPRVAGLAAEQRLSGYLREIVTGVTATVASCAALLMFEAKPLLGLLFGSGAEGAAPILALLAAVIPLSYFNILITTALLASGQPRAQIRVAAVGALVLTAGVVTLVPLYGAVGAAAALVVAEVSKVMISAAAYRWLAQDSLVRQFGTTASYFAAAAIPTVALSGVLPAIGALAMGVSGAVVIEMRLGRARRFLCAARRL